MTVKEEAQKFIGSITCTDMEEQPDGTWKVTFDYDKKFKDEYKKIFKLKRWSKKHFEKQLDIAIKNLAKDMETEEGLQKLKQDLSRFQE